MNKTTAPAKTPSPAREANQSDSVVGNANPRSEFFAAALNMSWQLAIVVLVPILGGFELDKKFKTAPAITIVGFIIAMAGMAAVVWRQLQLYSPTRPTTPKGHHS